MPKLRERVRSRLKRFDKLYASAALYACLSFALITVSFLGVMALGSVLCGFLPQDSQPAVFLTTQLGTVFLAAILGGAVLGKLIRSIAPKTGERGIALGGALIYASFAWTFLRPLYLQWNYHEVSAISKIVTIVDTLIYLTPHITAFLVFGKKKPVRESG